MWYTPRFVSFTTVTVTVKAALFTLAKLYPDLILFSEVYFAPGTRSHIHTLSLKNIHIFTLQSENIKFPISHNSPVSVTVSVVRYWRLVVYFAVNYNINISSNGTRDLGNLYRELLGGVSLGSYIEKYWGTFSRIILYIFTFYWVGIIPALIIVEGKHILLLYSTLAT